MCDNGASFSPNDRTKAVASPEDYHHLTHFTRNTSFLRRSLGMSHTELSSMIACTTSVLGSSLDKLVEKLESNQIEAALSGVKAFNKEPTFYSGYARNFISKTVKNNADADPRVGYIKQASTLIGSLEGVLTGGDALMNEKSTTKEAVARVKKAQSLIAKFIAECGIQDEKLAAFVSAHK